jgi:hypothetical protein
MIVDTRNWWPDKKVLVSPEWVERVDWSGSKVQVGVTREQIEKSPEYEAFILGTVMGGVAVWLWGSAIEGYLGEKTRGVRTQAADAMRSVEETTGQVLDGSGNSLHRAEGVLQNTKERVSAALRAGQDAIRPAPTTREA